MSENKQMKKDMPSLNSSMNMLDIEMELNRFSGDPTYQPLITMAKYLRTGQEEGMRQATDSWRIFAREKKCIDGRLLVKYQHSITTQNFMKAIEEYETGSNLLQDYKKKSVDTEGDCDYLKPAFENYVNGHMHENSFFGNIISKDTSNLVDQYLKLKPDDFMVEYLKVLFVLTCSPSDHEKSLFSDYERNKLVIRTGEIFAHKLKSSKIRTSERKKVLSELYYYLGSRYVASCQIERALNSFQKSFHRERSNYCALYGIAYCYMKSEPEKAKTHFYQYLEMAPSCDKKFPNAYYMLATLFVETNIEEALRYCALAEKAENERLPFLQPVGIPQKKLMQTLKSFQKSTSLKLCSKCKKAAYCSKECQSKHWKRHRHLCKLLRETYTMDIQMIDTVPFMDVGPNMVGIRQFDSSLVGIQESPPPDRMSSKLFLAKIQTGEEYGYYDPYKTCFKNRRFVLCIQTDNLPLFQTW